jgi:hypothetical protein
MSHVEEVEPVHVGENGAESLDELDIKEGTTEGDKVFITTVSGSRYLIEHLKKEHGKERESAKFAVYRRNQESAAWGVPDILYRETELVVQKGKRFRFLIAGSETLRPRKTSIVDQIEIHRGGRMQ